MPEWRLFRGVIAGEHKVQGGAKRIEVAPLIRDASVCLFPHGPSHAVEENYVESVDVGVYKIPTDQPEAD